MPVLPDVMVPAMPAGAGNVLPAKAAPGRAVIAAQAPAAELPAPAVVPVVVASPPAPRVVWQPTLPAYAPAPAPSAPPSVETVAIPREVTIDVPVKPPAFHVDNVPIGMAHTGDRPRAATVRQPFASPFAGNTPRPAAAVAPEQAGPAADGGDPAPTRGRRPARTDPAEQSHRGPASPQLP